LEAKVPPEVAEKAAEDVASYEARIVAIENRIDARFAAFESKLDARFSEFERKLETRFATMETRQNSLDSKIDCKFNSVVWMFGVLSAPILLVLGRTFFT
jgi:flagellar capping protein FliD